MDAKRAKAAILLSTFNGEKFLREQLASLYAQESIDLHIFARDDGSSDATLCILKECANEKGRLTVFHGGNCGFIQSFFELLRLSGDAYDFYFFCDQDDVWLPQKMAAATAMLVPYADQPSLYFSRTTYVDQNLSPLGMSQNFPLRRVGWGNAIVQNVATGCTMAMNARARRLLLNKFPNQCMAHDWWAYLVVSAFGRVVFDARSYILYRQHGGNAIGMVKGGFLGFFARVKRFMFHRSSVGIIDQLMEFLRIYSAELDVRQRRLLDILIASRNGGRASMVAATRGGYWRMRWVDHLILRLVLLSGKY